MATYFSQKLNRAISYNKKFIKPEKIEKIIEFIEENRCPKYRTDGCQKIFKYSKAHKSYMFITLLNFQTQKSKYIIKMHERIYEMM